ncbi:helix-turn-helix domain-containing protein [Streptomyces johnsoniae]|uniref:Scr1 family TA system antitoxin-like transcriptional regulator n=1 Tax=Streptomyces johnsoniae TaxID=3075532 RepID=A0ABU2RZA4_9ACTN|nr:Scr1 family TA system antitoxin-like transcriptional regulator [Streptomyces sp. DSM 41886]MDT0442063.1 Scr1 family TA system antitoxin-like transcriptional regulator [Streptomyces sp. DSM 41886]
MEPHENDEATPSTMLGELMRYAREESGLSLRTLGEEIHFPYGFLDRVERGEQEATENLVKQLDSHFRTGGLFTGLFNMAQDALIGDADIEAWAAARIKRQRIFEREEPPLYEAALKRPPLSKQVMSGQLAHLTQMTHKAHIAIQVLPFSEGLHPMPAAA